MPMTAGVNSVATNMYIAGQWQGALVVVENPAAPLRGAAAVEYASASSFVVSFPAGSQVGDMALMQVCAAYDITAPSGWTQLYLLNGTVWNVYIGWRILTSGDISTGHVTVNAAGTYNGSSNIVVFDGATVIREIVTAIIPLGASPWWQFVTSGAVLATDFGIGFGSCRGVGAMPSFTPGVSLASDVNGSFDTAVYGIPTSPTSPTPTARGYIFGPGWTYR
jgi:hypothetical protein